MGGFLGAGKTTMISRLANQLVEEGRRVAVITNDQGDALVDSGYLSRNLNVGEVTGGCFCCNFDDLIRNADQLLSEYQPEIIFAEPVGSCTDLMATVVAPIRYIYPQRFSVAPLMVLVDVERATNSAFNRGSLMGYLRKHQVEEAEVIVISKSDLANEGAIDPIIGLVREINASAKIISCSAVGGEHVNEILELILSDTESEIRSVDIDYGTYARAEAELGWYNGVFEFSGGSYDSYDLISRIFRRLSSEYHPEDIAHTKVMIISDVNAVKMSLVQGSISVGGVSGSRYGEGTSRMTINARIVSEPGRLREILRESTTSALKTLGQALGDWRDDSFSPSPPNPTHRIY